MFEALTSKLLYYRWTLVLVLVILTLLGTGLSASAKRCWENRVKDDLLGPTSTMASRNPYDRSTRPVLNYSTTVNVTLGISLYHILETHEKMQTISTLLSVRASWYDEFLTWNRSAYGDVRRIWLPADMIWLPDLVTSNNAGEGFSAEAGKMMAIVYSNGLVLWMFPVVLKTSCTLDVEDFPFDSQRCEIIFISWTYSGLELDVFPEDKQSANYYLESNHEWHVSRIDGDRRVRTYACCPESFPDVRFVLHMHRRSTFYILNLICPCCLLFMLSFLGFLLPIGSGDKVNLEMTIFLALTVFLMIVAETLPPTPDAIPFVGKMFGATMFMVALSLVMGVIVTNLYHRNEGSTPVPRWARRLFLRRRGGGSSAASSGSRGSVFAAAASRQRRRAGRSSQRRQRSWGGMYAPHDTNICSAANCHTIEAATEMGGSLGSGRAPYWLASARGRDYLPNDHLLVPLFQFDHVQASSNHVAGGGSVTGTSLGGTGPGGTSASNSPLLYRRVPSTNVSHSRAEDTPWTVCQRCRTASGVGGSAGAAVDGDESWESMRDSEEWRELARRVDSLCFLLFVGITVVGAAYFGWTVLSHIT